MIVGTIMEFKDLCAKYTEYLLIAGIFLVAVGLIFASQGSAQIKESSFEDFQGETTKYTYEVLGPRQLLGMIIVLLGAIINGVGGAIGGWSLPDVEENDEISSNLRWANIVSLINGLFLFSIGFYWAVTNEMQTFSQGDIAIQVPTHLAVEQVFGLFLLASGLIMSISAGYVAGTKGFLAFKGVKEIEETGQKSLWQESDVYGEYTKSYKRVTQIGLLMMGVGAVLILSLFARGRLSDFSNISIISIMLFFIGLIVTVPGVWGYFKEKRLEGKNR